MADVEKRSVASDTEEPTSSTKRKAEIDEIEVDLALPEPPSKKARRALKKGKTLPAKAGSDDEQEGEDGQKKDKKEKTRSEHGVWIGNLPFRLTAAELRTWLIDNSGGVITEASITRIKLPTVKEPGRDKSEKPTNKGFAYVDFADIGAKVAAIALSETGLAARRLLIKDSKSFEGRPAKEKETEEATDAAAAKTPVEQRQENNASRKVFVGNMSFKTTQDDLVRNFEKCGEIEWAKLATFEDTGKCKGFGWVKFVEPEAAAWAVKGFIKIKERIETEDDFKDDGDNSDEEDKSKQQQKQFKSRKWWVNRMLGRELKLELAEDDQSRYKKRFGKDAPKTDRPERAPRPDRNNGGNNNRSRDNREGGRDKRDVARPAAPLKMAEDIQVARLTGAVVQHTGTKMTFD